MTREELRNTVQAAVDALETIEASAVETLAMRNAIAKSQPLTVAEAWAEFRTMATGDTYQTLELTLTHYDSGRLDINWQYYDKETCHVDGKDLKTLVALVKAIKQANVAKPQTLDDAAAALGQTNAEKFLADPFSRVPEPSPETLGVEF